MKISLNWLSDYIDVSVFRTDLRAVIQKLAMCGIEIESVEDLSKGFDRVVVAQIKERNQHPNADRLSVCKVDNGSEIFQIVCGAQNMKAGDKVALSQIGAVIPNGMKIEKTKIRDIESLGMLCSEIELGLAKESSGILILPDDTKVGQPLAQFLGRDDLVLELNVTPNRGDILSHIGFAREVASIFDLKVKLPNPKLKEAKQASSDKIRVELHSEPGKEEICYQYHGRYFENVEIAPSPDWLQKRLKAIGLRPINNIVDITNFVLMEWGTPLHAFDYDQIQGQEIHVRSAKDGEKIMLLDDTEATCSSSDIVIADKERAVALGGVMGGKNSQVTNSTKRILLEAAQFLPSAIRKTARRLQKQSDSSYRFERQIDALAVPLAIDRAASLIAELAKATVFKETVSQRSKGLSKKTKPAPIRVSVDLANQFLGLGLSAAEVKKSLGLIGFATKGAGNALQVSPPSYRPDVEHAEDVYEEILRVWGYDKVEARVPRLEFIPDSTSLAERRLRLVEKLKFSLAEQGFHEAVNFAFASDKQNEKWGGLHKTQAVRLENPLNAELTTLKTSLIGGLFENLIRAISFQQGNIRLFEIRPIYWRNEGKNTGVLEEWVVAGLCMDRSYTHPLAARDRNLDFFDIKGIVEKTLESINCRGFRVQAAPELESLNLLHPAQSASIALGKGPCGWFGRLHPRIEAEEKLQTGLWGFEFSLDRALEVVKHESRFSSLPKYPKVLRDFSLIVPELTLAGQVVQTIDKLGKPLVESVSVVDVFSGEKVGPDKRSLSVSLVLGQPNRTLEDAEVEAISQKILAGLDTQLGVKLRLV